MGRCSPKPVVRLPIGRDLATHSSRCRPMDDASCQRCRGLCRPDEEDDQRSLAHVGILAWVVVTPFGIVCGGSTLRCFSLVVFAQAVLAEMACKLLWCSSAVYARIFLFAQSLEWRALRA